jgi:hypothetical protein
MTAIPFVCAKSGQEFLPGEGGKCGLCKRLLLAQYLHSKVFARQLAPICTDCLNDLGELARKDKLPGPWLKGR